MSRFARLPLVPPSTWFVAVSLGLGAAASAWATNYPITPGQRATAQQVAEAGVPLSELSPTAPDSYTIKRGDTLWDISKLFLKSPWRWPELWGMNMDDIRNPHLIYPGQILYLDKTGGRARLRTAKPIGDEKLSPRVRAEPLPNDAIASVPMHLIGPFLNDAVVLDTNTLATAPRVVATQEGRVIVSKGENAYVRGDLSAARNWQLFREPKPLVDPVTQEVLGFEARYVGAADYVRPGEVRTTPDGKSEIIPATITITNLREEANIGDRLSPAPARDVDPFAPHAPGAPMSGRIISVYGDGLNAGQNQIVSLNKGARDGIERGHVMAVWRAGTQRVDNTEDKRELIRLPDERHGLMFVFRVFERVSYALILNVQDPVTAGDLFTQP
ncbi:MAG TPA: LysM peptidoglycan-binding domain-containing protein [Ideonella sp.]|uniref:LysM peptidoglycan-binding domain-containing protein n=1 Tax=Ideonella sp. TaxID=1929293 RepID=UPI002E33781A|nr:LysM peptidoglycan-binding domain-containing protein [Ideonella sp.]HEX5684768.1 LysM peptidoglycan-binding domain-containing protein [Ideonella sp.]